MAEKEEQEVFIYVTVDEPGKPENNTRIVYRNKRGYTDKNTGEVIPESCRTIDAIRGGYYLCNIFDEFFAEKKATLDRLVKKQPGVVLGPFASFDAAFAAKEKARPKTDKELAAHAESRAARAESELAKLKEKTQPK